MTEIKKCGEIILTNHNCYQDFIGNLINNGYGVRVIPNDEITKLNFEIYKLERKESEEK